MAEPKPLIDCNSCDHICENEMNEDSECWSRMTTDQRIAFARALMTEDLYQEVVDPRTLDGT